jgi:hypothetical protein
MSLAGMILTTPVIVHRDPPITITHGVHQASINYPATFQNAPPTPVAENEEKQSPSP